MATAGFPSEEAIQISRVEGSFMLFDMVKLYSILCQPDVVDKKVVVISVTGDVRSGKSFLLNYLLRYLKADGTDGWLGRPDEKLDGFDWSGGLDTVTKGLWAWNKLLVCRGSAEDGDVHIMLLDTENINYLIRDWNHPDEYRFGSSGGQAYWKYIFPANQDNERKNRLQRFYSCHRPYLLPRIGKHANGSKRYDGRHSEFGETFTVHFKKFIREMFTAVPLEQKRICDVDMTCRDLYKYCENINNLVMDRGGIRSLSILEADLFHFYSQEREKYAEYYDMQMREKDAECIIMTADDNYLCRRAFKVFKTIIRQERIPGEGPEEIIHQLSMAGEGLMNTLRTNLKHSGSFLEAVLNKMKAKMEAYVNHAYGGNHGDDTLPEMWMFQSDHSISNMEPELQQETTDDYDVEPSDFCDAITCTLMDNPVLLPVSRMVVELSTILRHLIDNGTDPFNRVPLEVDELIPLPELRERIEAWKFDREVYRREHPPSD